MRPTLTLTYGLGWALESRQLKRPESRMCWWTRRSAGHHAGYLASVKSAALAGKSTIPKSVLPSWATPRNGLKYPYNPFYGEFSPRVAVAWNPRFDGDSLGGKIFGHDSTVIRGGYGRGYGRTNGVVQVLVPLLGTRAGTSPSRAKQPSRRLSLDLRRFAYRHLWGLRIGGLSRRVSPISSSRPTVPLISNVSTTLPQPIFPGFNNTFSGRRRRVWIRISGPT